jgi:hypothetical protein
MLNDSTGWAVGDGGCVFKRSGRLHPSSTEQVWVSKTITTLTPQEYWDFKGVCFTDEQNGWIVGYKNNGSDKYKGVIIHMENGVWLTPIYSTDPSLLGSTQNPLTPFLKVKMAKPATYYEGYISCGNGYILKYQHDGTWLPIRPPAPNNDPVSVWYKDLWMNSLNPDELWALGDNSGIFAGTQNGGLSWNFEYPSQFSQTYDWPLNTNTPLGTRLASLSLYGSGYNDMNYGMSYGL